MLNAFLTIGIFQLVTMAVLLVRTKALALLLGPDGVGVLAIVDKLLATVGQAVSLSLPFAAVRFLPELWRRDHSEFLSLVRPMRNMLIFVGLVSTSVGVIVTWLDPRLWGAELLPYRTIVFSGFISLPVIILVPFLQNAIAGRLAHNFSALFILGHALVLTLASIAGVWVGGLSTFYILYALVGMVLVIFTIVFVERKPAGAIGSKRLPFFQLKLPRKIWNFSLAVWALAFITPFAALYVHYIVLRSHGIEVAGWMQCAMAVGLAVRNLLGRAHPLFLTPNVNSGGSVEERMCWASDFQKTFSMLSLVPALPLLLFPHLIVSMLYSPAFLPAAPFVALFVINEVLTLLTGTYQALILAFDHLAFHVFQNLIAQAMLIAVATVSVPQYGVLGAGLASICAQLVLYCGSVLFLRRRHKFEVPVRSMMLSSFIIMSLIASGIFGALHAELSWGIVTSKLSVYAISVAGMVTLLSAADRANLFGLFNGLSHRLASVGARGES